MIASNGALALHAFLSLKSGLYHCPGNPDPYRCDFWQK
jgi:hypothetical protein